MLPLSKVGGKTYPVFVGPRASSIDFKKSKAFYRKVSENDVASIIFSRKSNGELRGAMLTHKSMLYSAFYGTLGIKNVFTKATIPKIIIIARIINLFLTEHTE